MTMLEATAEANNRNAFDLALKSYKSDMKALMGPDAPYIKESAAAPDHLKILNRSLDIFTTIATMGSESSIESYKTKLLEELENERKRYYEANALKVLITLIYIFIYSYFNRLSFYYSLSFYYITNSKFCKILHVLFLPPRAVLCFFPPK